MAAIFNFAAYFFIKDHKVANTVAKIVNETLYNPSRNIGRFDSCHNLELTTWWFGIPSSSSHTLIGGFAGAGVTNALYLGAHGLDAVNLHYILTIIAYIVLAPFIGLS